MFLHSHGYINSPFCTKKCRVDNTITLHNTISSFLPLSVNMIYSQLSKKFFLLIFAIWILHIYNNQKEWCPVSQSSPLSNKLAMTHQTIVVIINFELKMYNSINWLNPNRSVMKKAHQQIELPLRMQTCRKRPINYTWFISFLLFSKLYTYWECWKKVYCKTFLPPSSRLKEYQDIISPPRWKSWKWI